MNFSTPSLVDQVIWDLRTADSLRGMNRAQIDRLFSGFPPWTQDEVTANQIRTNVNWLDAPKLAADARRSYYNAFLKPSIFFSMNLNTGSSRTKASWSAIVTKEMNRIMKRSLPYFETLRSQIAETVLHGIGPVHWCDDQFWRPRAIDIPDILVPSDTLLSMENLDYFAIFRQYTAPKLSDMISKQNVDPGWNIDLAKRAVQWCYQQSSAQSGQAGQSDWLVWEKLVEQIKQDSVYYGSDVTPTIDCWDFYYYSTEGKTSGWRRCMVLDTPTNFEVQTNGRSKPDKNLIGEDNQEWLYNGGKRIYADSINQIIHFQFGDLSPKGPFKYHSVRSLGWLIYAVCNLHNRLLCKINDATFENLLNYFRIGNPDDNERLTKIDLHNYGVIPEGVEFVKQQDRWQVNQSLVGSTMGQNRQMLNEAAAQFREGRDTQAGVEKTATQIMAEVNAANALVGSMLLLAYTYQKAQYEEIARRFFIPNSRDKEVREFRLRVLKRGVPEKLLDIDYWDVSPEQVLGNGNKILQIAMADKLMAIRPLLDSDSQRDALRLYIEANSDDPGLGLHWVPDQPLLATSSVHDAQLMIGSVMTGATVQPAQGQDPAEMTTALLQGMAEICKRIVNTTMLPTQSELIGLTNLATVIDAYILVLQQDNTQKAFVKQAQKDLGNLVELLRQWGTQVSQQAQPQAQPQQPPPEQQKEQAITAAKIQSIAVTAKAKADIAQMNAAQKREQREAQFAQKQRQSEEAHIADLRKKLRETETDATIKDIKAATDIANTPLSNA